MSKTIKISIGLLIAMCAGILLILVCTSCNKTQATYDKYFDAEFHRGGRDSRPENTLYSYTFAIEQGATTIEGDMQLTKDGVIVMSHNPMLNPDFTQDENGNYVQPNSVDIRTTTYEELQKYNVGHMNKNSEYYKEHGTTQIEHDAKIPRLEDLLQLVKDSGNSEIMLNLETKLYPDPATGYYHTNNVDAKTFAEKVNEVITEYDMSDRVVIQSFDLQILPMIKKLNSKIKTAALWSETNSEDQGIGTLWIERKEPSPWLAGYNIHDFQDDAVGIAYALNCDIISPEYNQITSPQITYAHKYGMKVVPWTVNTKEQMQKMINMGCDGIISDKGLLLREVLEENSKPLMGPWPFDSKYHLD